MEWIKNNLPLISIGLLVIGFSKLIAYYAFFGIDITSYLEATEILQLEFKFFAFAFVILVIGSLNFLSGIGKTMDLINEFEAAEIKRIEEGGADEPMAELNWFDRNSLAVGAAIFAIGAFILCAYDRMQLHLVDTSHTDIFILFVFAFFVFLKLGNVVKTLEKIKPEIVGKLLAAISFIPILLIVVIWVRREAFGVMTRKPNKEVALVLESRTVKTDSSLIFVGKTRNYVFLYNKDKEEAEVIPVDKIEDAYYREGMKNTRIPKTFQIK